MRTALMLPAMLCIALLAQGRPAPADASVTIDRVVAIVNNEVITMSDLQREIARARGAVSQETMLEEMINKKLQMSAAKREGMDVTEQELSEAISDILKRNSMDRATFEEALAKEGLTIDQYRQELKEQMAISRLFNKHVRTGLSVDDREIREYYDSNLGSFSLPEEVRIRQILFRVSPSSSLSQRSSLELQAKTVATRARSGEDFTSLVREYAGDRNTSDSGDLGFMQREHLLPPLSRAVSSLKPGEIAGPIETEMGYHIIKLEEIRRRAKPFEQVRDEIANQLYNQKLENTYRTWLQTLRNDSHIENRL